MFLTKFLSNVYQNLDQIYKDSKMFVFCQSRTEMSITVKAFQTVTSNLPTSCQMKRKCKGKYFGNKENAKPLLEED